MTITGDHGLGKFGRQTFDARGKDVLRQTAVGIVVVEVVDVSAVVAVDNLIILQWLLLLLLILLLLWQV